MNSTLLQKSIDVILNNQDDQGGYIASPNFEQYTYYWLRDGAYTAYAMDSAGHTLSASKFHTWVIHTILHNEKKILNCIYKVEHHKPIQPAEYLHCRFNADGSEARGDWAYHQLDGLAVWLWTFGEHCLRLNKDKLCASEERALQLATAYLTALWNSPCYDSWEEDKEGIHTYTLATIYGGLEKISHLLPGEEHLATHKQIKTYILHNLQQDGRFVKSSLRDGVDANLLGLVVPFQVIPHTNKVFRQTLKVIEEELLSPTGGLHRYAHDIYYGGGEWILLSAWLGLVYAQIGQRDKAAYQLQWVENQFSAEGYLPEQTSHHLLDESHYQLWHKKWGQIASPLLWSHAMHILLHLTLLQE